MRGMKIFLVLVLLLGIGGTAFLSNWTIPAPVKTISKVIPDERFKN